MQKISKILDPNYMLKRLSSCEITNFKCIREWVCNKLKTRHVLKEKFVLHSCLYNTIAPLKQEEILTNKSTSDVEHNVLENDLQQITRFQIITYKWSGNSDVITKYFFDACWVFVKPFFFLLSLLFTLDEMNSLLLST